MNVVTVAMHSNGWCKWRFSTNWYAIHQKRNRFSGRKGVRQWTPRYEIGFAVLGIMALFVVPLLKRTQCSSLLPATGTEVSIRHLRFASPVQTYAPPATSATSIVCRVRMCKAVYVYRLSFFAKQTATESEIGNNCTLGSVNVRAW